MTFSLTTYDEDETIALGERLAMFLDGGNVVLLDGDLGAGKTRFSKGVARGLGVKQELTSPTFNLVLEYPLNARGNNHSPSLKAEASQPAKVHASDVCAVRVLYHFDLYRLDSAEQLDDLDYFGLLESEDSVSLVEWGSKFAESMPVDYIRVDMKVAAGSSQQRSVEFSAVGTRSTETLACFSAAEEARRYA